MYDTTHKTVSLADRVFDKLEAKIEQLSGGKYKRV